MKPNESGIIRHLSVAGALFLVTIFVGGCSHQEAPTDSSIKQSPGVLSKGGIIHHVSVGGPDVVPPGEDANFSLVANMDADGNVSGQWQDVFGGHVGSIHVAVDCMTIVPPGNRAIIGGVITRGTVNGVDVSGQRAVTAVVDNGRSANDPPDRISLSFFDPSIQVCGTYPFNVFPLFAFTRGQVTVR